MGSLIYIYTIVLLFAVVPLGIAKEQLSSRECENLGFTGLALCSDCNTLAEYVKDQGNLNLHKNSLSFWIIESGFSFVLSLNVSFLSKSYLICSFYKFFCVLMLIISYLIIWVFKVVVESLLLDLNFQVLVMLWG